MAQKRRGQRKDSGAQRREASGSIVEGVILASFACSCGAEIELSPDATLTSEIACVRCGEWIGVYAELVAMPAARPPRVTPASPARSSGRGRRSRGRCRSRY